MVFIDTFIELKSLSNNKVSIKKYYPVCNLAKEIKFLIMNAYQYRIKNCEWVYRIDQLLVNQLIIMFTASLILLFKFLSCMNKLTCVETHFKIMFSFEISFLQ